MNDLTGYMRQPGRTSQLTVLVDGELSRNERSVDAAVGLSEGERLVLHKWISEARSFCIDNTLHSTPKDSVLGKTVKERVYTSLRHDVDFVTLKGNGAFLCSEMKFGLKPNSYGPFARARMFISKVAVKFDELELALTQDEEEYVKLRVLLVSDEHFELLHAAIEDLKNADDVCSSDGRRHDYLLCTISGLLTLLVYNITTENTFKFTV